MQEIEWVVWGSLGVVNKNRSTYIKVRSFSLAVGLVVHELMADVRSTTGRNYYFYLNKKEFLNFFAIAVKLLTVVYKQFLYILQFV